MGIFLFILSHNLTRKLFFWYIKIVKKFFFSSFTELLWTGRNFFYRPLLVGQMSCVTYSFLSCDLGSCIFNPDVWDDTSFHVLTVFRLCLSVYPPASSPNTGLVSVYPLAPFPDTGLVSVYPPAPSPDTGLVSVSSLIFHSRCFLFSFVNSRWEIGFFHVMQYKLCTFLRRVSFI